MFIKGEDYYYLTYNIFVVLDAYNCYGDRKFKDYRKISHLIDIVGNRRVCVILSKKILNKFENVLLSKSYSNALVRDKIIRRILFALEKKGYINIDRSLRGKTIDLSLNKKVEVNNLLNAELFCSEIENINNIKKYVSKINIISFDNFMTELYESRGIRTWGI